MWKKRGYKIPHGPGHSFGLDIHEAPFISAANDYQLQPGVIHTIEPESMFQVLAVSELRTIT